MKTEVKFLIIALFLGAAANNVAAVHYVAANNGTPMPPYTNWSVAAATIQDAIESKQLARVALQNRPYQCPVCVASATACCGREQCIGELAERYRGDLFPAAKYGRDLGIRAAGNEHPWPAWHYFLHRN